MESYSSVYYKSLNEMLPGKSEALLNFNFRVANIKFGVYSLWITLLNEPVRNTQKFIPNTNTRRSFEL